MKTFKELEKECWIEYQSIKSEYVKKIKKSESTLKLTKKLRRLQSKLIIQQLEEDKIYLSKIILKAILKNKHKLDIYKKYLKEEKDKINQQIKDTKTLYKKEIKILI